MKALAGGKSALLLACKGCGSRLSREHSGIRARNLPALPLLSDSVRKRLDSLKSKHDGRKGRDAPQGKKTGKYGWAIGGTASS